MKIHHLVKQQILPISLEKAWKFFSTPNNLNLLTPKDMSFEIISGAYETTYPGQIIIYKIKPILNISMNWVTEITQCFDRKYFIDEQRFGPYSFWHHQHHFQEIEEGILMKDILHYSLPFGFFGELLGRIFIHKKIQEVFSYREEKLKKLFNT